MSNSETNNKADWSGYDDGYSVGMVGASGGAIVRDEKHKSGARVTLEAETSFAAFAVTCGIYGWMFHTRYLTQENAAFAAYKEMREELEKVLESMPSDEGASEENREEFAEELEMFVEKFS